LKRLEPQEEVESPTASLQMRYSAY